MGLSSAYIWLYLEKGLRLANALIIGLWVANYLGPVSFGQFSLALGIVLLITPFSSWGIDALIVRRLVGERESPLSILGSAFLLRLGLGLIGWLAIVGLGYWYQGEVLLFWVILGSMLPLGAFRVFEFHLQSKERATSRES